MPSVGNQPPVEAPVNRWVQLVAGVICMVMIANLQYGWTYFVDPIDAKFHWGRTSIQVAFTIFVATETWLVPIEGWFVDRFGLRLSIRHDGRLGRAGARAAGILFIRRLVLRRRCGVTFRFRGRPRKVSIDVVRPIGRRGVWRLPNRW